MCLNWAFASVSWLLLDSWLPQSGPLEHFTDLKLLLCCCHQLCLQIAFIIIQMHTDHDCWWLFQVVFEAMITGKYQCFGGICCVSQRMKHSKGRFTYSMPCPCRATNGVECVFHIWFTQCGRVWFTLAMPCHVLTMPFFSRPWHSTSIERRPVGYQYAFGFFWLPRRVPWRLLSEAYQSQVRVTSVKQNNVCHGWGKEW